MRPANRLTVKRLALTTALSVMMLAASPALTQAGPFDPVVTVNDRVITQFELDQRARFLTLLRAATDPQKEAEKTLIEDRLRMTEARRLGITPSEEDIQQGMDEFASRANMTGEQFVAALQGAGVSRETYRDFVTAGLAWRLVVRQKYAGRVNITEAEVDKEIARGAKAAGPARVLLSELIIPAPPGREQAALAQAQKLANTIRSEAGFSAAARKYSASGSRGRGGKIDWMDMANLPPELRQQILVLGPGGVSQPYALNGAIAIFYVRAFEKGTSGKAQQTIDYAQFFIAGGQSEAARAEAARIRARVDNCDDLYTVARGLPAEQLQRETQPQGAIPSDIAYELAKLDAGEVSTALTRGDAMVFLMLCARQDVPTDPVVGADGEALGPDRDAARSEILNRRLTGFADRDLAALRASAIITRP